MNTSEKFSEIAAALARANASLRNPERSKTVTVRGKMKNGEPFEYSFDYAPLDEILDGVRPIYAAEGLFLIQSATVDGLAVETRIVHSSGEWLSTLYPVHVPPDADAKQYAGAFTYARRNAVSATVSLFAETDDDGNAGSGDSATVAARPGRKAGAKLDVSSMNDYDKSRGWGIAGGVAVCSNHAVALALKSGVSKTSGKPYRFYACPERTDAGDYCPGTANEHEIDAAKELARAPVNPPGGSAPAVSPPAPASNPSAVADAPPADHTASRLADFRILIDEAETPADLKRIAALAAKQSKEVRDALRPYYEAKSSSLKSKPPAATV